MRPTKERYRRTFADGPRREYRHGCRVRRLAKILDSAGSHALLDPWDSAPPRSLLEKQDPSEHERTRWLARAQTSPAKEWTVQGTRELGSNPPRREVLQRPGRPNRTHPRDICPRAQGVLTCPPQHQMVVCFGGAEDDHDVFRAEIRRSCASRRLVEPLTDGSDSKADAPMRGQFI